MVEVRTLNHAVHSGKYGGPVPDALTALCLLIATLHDAGGEVAVKGLHTGPSPGVEMDRGPVAPGGPCGPMSSSSAQARSPERIWARPAVAVLGIDAPPVAGAAHKIVPWARASISVRLAPGDDAERAFLALEEHLHRHAPWHAEVTVTRDHQGGAVPDRRGRGRLRRVPPRLRGHLGLRSGRGLQWRIAAAGRRPRGRRIPTWPSC